MAKKTTKAKQATAPTRAAKAKKAKKATKAAKAPAKAVKKTAAKTATAPVPKTAAKTAAKKTAAKKATKATTAPVAKKAAKAAAKETTAKKATKAATAKTTKTAAKAPVAKKAAKEGGAPFLKVSAATLKRKLAAARAPLKPGKGPKSIGAGVHVAYATLVGLIGKHLGHPAVTAVLAAAGTLKGLKTGNFVVANEAGFDLALGPNPDNRQENRQIVSLFLFADGSSRHRAFAGLPAPFVWGDRAAVLAAAPTPVRGLSYTKGRKTGAMPLTADVYRDEWKVGGMTFAANYKKGVVSHYQVLRR